MQQELAAAPGSRPVQILGVNHRVSASGNPNMTAGHDLPWLQDTAEADVWAAWEVTARDVVIVGPDGGALEVYNVTANDLSDPGNYAALRDLLRQAAGP